MEVLSLKQQQVVNETLMLSISVGKGHNQLRRSLGLYSQNYHTEKSVTTHTSNLSPFETEPESAVYTGGPTTCLVVHCWSPISFVGTLPDDSTVELTVNHMMILDQPLKSFTLTNNGDESARVNVDCVS